MRALRDSTDRLGGIDLGAAHHFLLHELIEPVVLPLRLTEPRFVFRRRPARRHQLRLRHGHRGPNLRVIQPGEDLALLDGLAFLDEDLEDLARDLR